MTRDQTEVSPLAWEAYASIQPITGWPSLFLSSSTRCAIPVPYGSATIRMGRNGLTQLIEEEKRTSEVGVCLPVRALGVATVRSRQSSASRTILVAACQPLWPFPTHERCDPSHLFNLPVLPWAASASRLAESGLCPKSFAPSRYQERTSW